MAALQVSLCSAGARTMGVTTRERPPRKNDRLAGNEWLFIALYSSYIVINYYNVLLRQLSGNSHVLYWIPILVHNILLSRWILGSVLEFLFLAVCFCDVVRFSKPKRGKLITLRMWDNSLIFKCSSTSYFKRSIEWWDPRWPVIEWLLWRRPAGKLSQKHVTESHWSRGTWGRCASNAPFARETQTCYSGTFTAVARWLQLKTARAWSRSSH